MAHRENPLDEVPDAPEECVWCEKPLTEEQMEEGVYFCAPPCLRAAENAWLGKHQGTEVCFIPFLEEMEQQALDITEHPLAFQGTQQQEWMETEDDK